ncbi:MAG: lamin tail domain-containing protein [Candidatus Omnitrophota bacterium]
MRIRCLLLVIAVLLVSNWGASRAEAFIFINEFLADPATGLAGDANNDGVRDSYDDEFVELFNLSSENVNLSNWYISDASSDRHFFNVDTYIKANSTFVVFGGGSPNLPGIDWQIASQGQLNLNNGGDTITLRDASGNVIDSYAYGTEAGYDQSIVRNPEGTKSAWIKHTELPNADGKLFSPGFLINPIEVPAQSTVPEPATICYLALGLGSMLFRRKK